jgi:hypothetical protein
MKNREVALIAAASKGMAVFLLNLLSRRALSLRGAAESRMIGVYLGIHIPWLR